MHLRNYQTDWVHCRAKHIYHRNGISELKSDKGPKHIGPQCIIIEQTAELNRQGWLYGGPSLAPYFYIVYNRNHYFGLGQIPKPKPKLADTFVQYRN